MNIATIEVSGVYASAKAYTHIPAGLVGATVTFEFTDPKWDGLSKTAVFKGNETRDVIMSENVVRLPSETVKTPGERLLIGVYGVDSDENIVIPTLWTDIGPIRSAADPSGDPGVDPSLPIWMQLKEEVDTLKQQGVGKPGKDGEDGFSPIAKVEKTNNGAVISITDKDGTTTTTINNGKDGGYYKPSVTQLDVDTLEFRYAPNNMDMPAVDPVQVKMPHSGGNVDGLVIQSKNLINPDGITVGQYIDSSGEVLLSESFKITGYIEVKPNTNYVYSHNSTKYDSAVRYAMYDSDKNLLEQHRETQNITTTENTAYVRISVPENRANMQLEEGTTATAYEPYYKWVNPEYVNALTKEESAEEIARIDAEILSLKIPGMPTADIPELLELYLEGLDTTRDVSVTQLRKNYYDGSKYVTTFRVAYSDATSQMIANFAFSSEQPIAWSGKMVIPVNAYYSTVSGYVCIDYDALPDNTSYYNAVQVDKSKITDIAKLPHIQNYRMEQAKCSGIVKLNKDVEHLVANASKSRSDEFDDVLVPLEFVHFTDVHAQTTQWNRVCDYVDAYETYIKFALHTGDYVGSSIASHIDLYGIRKPLNRPILNACGNHDIYLSDSNMSPEGVTQEQTHAIICSDTSDWGVTFGTEANAMYYYRDFAESGVRLIVLDDQHWTEAQATWFADVLASAKTSNLSVITASHMVTAKITERLDCSFTPADDYSAHRNFATQAFDGQIKAFKDDGGVHVCHLSGHYHFDDIGHTASGVLNVICECATPANAHTETVRVKGMKSYDCFNVVSVDVNTNRLKIVRIGNNSNASLKAKNVLCYDYAEKKVISNW